MVNVLKFVGWILAHAPTLGVRALAWLLGAILYFGVPWRVRLVHANLHHAFPERSRSWRRAVARKSCHRLAEMALFALASPYFTRQRVLANFNIPQDMRVAVSSEARQGRGSVFMIPHFTLSEMTTMCPVIDPIFDGTLGMFRPLNQGKIDAWVKHVRERWGCRLMSRKDELKQVHAALSDGDHIAILFDQNAGGAGLIFPFFDRLVSATHLPGLFAKRHRMAAFVMFPRRVGFWKVNAEWIMLEQHLSAEEIAFAAHDALAEHLARSADHCADWLWMHNRWKNAHTHFKKRFHLNSRKVRLNEYLAFHGQTETNKHTRYWFRLPGSHDEISSLEPHIHAISDARPDVEITLLGLAHEIEAASSWRDAWKHRLIPETVLARWRFIREMREEYADLYICLSDLPEDARLGWWLGIPQRLGWRTGTWSDRFHSYALPASAERSWQVFFSHFGA
jgi:heptosyltransferase II